MTDKKKKLCKEDKLKLTNYYNLNKLFFNQIFQFNQILLIIKKDLLI